MSVGAKTVCNVVSLPAIQVVKEHETYVVSLGAVELLNQIREVIDELSKLGGVLAVGNQLVDGVIRGAVVGWVVRAVVRRVVGTIVRRAVVGRAMVRVIEGLIERLQLRLEPGLSVESGIMDLLVEALNGTIGFGEGGIKRVLRLLGSLVPGILRCLGHFVEVLLEAREDVVLGGNGIIIP